MMSKAIDQDLELHVRELESFYFGDPSAREADQLSAAEIDRLQCAFLEDAAVPPARGRPPAHRSKHQRTVQSFEAFVFVTGEMRTFKHRHGLKQVPARVRDKFIDLAQRMCPLAEREIVLDHIRKDQRLLPHYDEPTCFLLVRHEFDDGTVADVVVAGPADGRK